MSPESHHLELSGIIEHHWGSYEEYDSIYLIQPDGYKVDLVGRLNEAIANFSSKVKVRYFITDSPTPKEQLIESFWKSVYGRVDLEHLSAEATRYSEWTPGVAETILRVGRSFESRGHDLMKELQDSEGKYLHLECAFDAA